VEGSGPITRRFLEHLAPRCSICACNTAQSAGYGKKCVKGGNFTWFLYGNVAEFWAEPASWAARVGAQEIIRPLKRCALLCLEAHAAVQLDGAARAVNCSACWLSGAPQPEVWSCRALNHLLQLGRAIFAGDSRQSLCSAAMWSLAAMFWVKASVFTLRLIITLRSKVVPSLRQENLVTGCKRAYRLVMYSVDRAPVSRSPACARWPS
jgi:hypothetical protein